MNTAAFKWMPAALLVLACALPSAHAQSTSGARLADQLHANAMASYRQGRFAEAYGRFIGLADAGHAPSAKLALWMYQNGTTVFGRDWDSTPEQQKAWAEAAAQPAVALQPMDASSTPKRSVQLAKR